MNITVNDWFRTFWSKTATEEPATPPLSLADIDPTLAETLHDLWPYLTPDEQTEVLAMAQRTGEVEREAERRKQRAANEGAIRLLQQWGEETDPEVIKDQQETLAILEQAFPPETP